VVTTIKDGMNLLDILTASPTTSTGNA